MVIIGTVLDEMMIKSNIEQNGNRKNDIGRNGDERIYGNGKRMVGGGIVMGKMIGNEMVWNDDEEAI